MSEIGGRFTLGKPLGAGAMGSVYFGTDATTGGPVAIKKLKKAIIERDPDAVRRFEREGEALARLNHPNIVRMLASVAEGEDHYIVLEYVPGGDLADLLKQQGQLKVARAMQIALDLADALTRAHRLGIVHRDLKPANVLLAEDGTPRLTDFGVAHVEGEDTLTEQGSLVGTYAYLSPEACMGLPLDERADIWSFGVILYEMLSGQRPYMGTSPAALVTAILNEPVPELGVVLPDAPEDLIDLIDRMLTKNRDSRIPSVRLVGAEIEAILRGGGRLTTATPIPAALRSSLEFAREHSPTKPLAPVSHNLPTPATPFIGRQAELGELRAMLHGECRLITVAGPGGAGKTRLALELAQQQVTVSSAFRDGIVFVPLAPLEGNGAIVGAIGEATGVQFTGGDPRAQIFDHLRNKQMLLVLDNFEHVLGSAELVGGILKEAPGVRLLVTSRVRLNVHGECLYEVGGMRAPTGSTDFDSAEAVAMFVAFAQRAQPGYELKPEDRTAVARITQIVDGMPLGLELAAAWARVLSPEEIAEELAEGLDFLETSEQGVPDRHRSIRAVFDYSWRLLSEEEQAVFRRLSVFRGGFDRKTAKKVAGASLLHLRDLVDKSLLRRTPEGRYFVHELLRQYAERALYEDYPQEAERVEEAHCRAYTEYIQKFTTRDLQSRGLDKFLTAFDLEYDNIRRAVDHASSRSDGETLSVWIEPLGVYYDSRARAFDGEALFGMLANGLRDTTYRLEYAQVLVSQARNVQRLGELGRGLALLDEALAIFEDLDEPALAAQTQTWRAYSLMYTGSTEEARRINEEAVATLEATGDVLNLQVARANLGYLYYIVGEYDLAREMMIASRYTQEGATNEIGMAYGFNNLGEVERAVGNYEEALRLYRRANELFTHLKNKRGMAFTLNNIVELLALEGQFETGIETAETALTLYREIGDRLGESNTLHLLGLLYAGVPGEFDRVRTCFEASLGLRRAVGDVVAEAATLNALGYYFVERGDYDIARQHLVAGHVAAQRAGAQSQVALALINLGALDFAEGKLDSARDLLTDGLAIARSIGEHERIAMALRYLGLVAIERDNLKQASTYLEESLTLNRSAQAVVEVALTLTWLGVIADREEDTQQANQYYAQALGAALEADYPIAGLPAVGQIGRRACGAGAHARGVQLMTLVLEYPLTQAGQRAAFKDHLADARSRMADEAFRTAQAEGRALTVEDVVRTLYDGLVQ